MTSAAQARPRVIVTVFDGLRPDLVKPELTPNILRVAARGTWFRNARSVFPSVTRVATSSIATGAPPAAPDVALTWFSEPDTSFHYLEIGSEGSMLARRNADKALG